MIAPLINASFYPAFTEYPGSISLRYETARDVIADTCISLSSFGLSRFYVINTGLSTLRPLAEVKVIAQVLLQHALAQIESLEI